MLTLSGPAPVSLSDAATDIYKGNLSVGNIASAYQQVQGKNIGQVATGLAASFLSSPVGPLIAGFLVALGFAKGKTERASGTDATRIANELAPPIYRRIIQSATVAQRNYLSEHLPGKTVDIIRGGAWWGERMVDNLNTANAFHIAFRDYLPSHDITNPWRIERSIWELVHWAVKNSPKDLTFLQSHLQQIFSQTVGSEMQQAYAMAPGEGGTVTVVDSPDASEASVAGPVPTWLKWVGTLVLMSGIGTIIWRVK